MSPSRDGDRLDELLSQDSVDLDELLSRDGLDIDELLSSDDRLEQLLNEVDRGDD